MEGARAAKRKLGEAAQPAGEQAGGEDGAGSKKAHVAGE